MKNVKIEQESYDLKEDLRLLLKTVNGNIRIFVDTGFGDNLVLIKKNGYSKIYPDLELLSIEYYQKSGIASDIWDIKGQEYFLCEDEDNALSTFIRRFTAVSPHKRTENGFDSNDCVSAYHNMRSVKNG